MSKRFSVSAVIPATPGVVYDAWLDGRKHAAMTGGGKAKASAKVGGAFTAFEGYAMGTNLELVPGEKIVQSWRTTDFAAADPDSRLTVTLKPATGGTKLTILHTAIPEGQDDYKSGWQEYYLEPMKTYFGKKRGQ